MDRPTLLFYLRLPLPRSPLKPFNFEILEVNALAGLSDNGSQQ